MNHRGTENTASAATDPPAELSGRVAVVTGSSSGIGRAVAVELAVAGAAVLVHANRSRQGADSTAEDCRARGARAEVVLADVGSAEGRRRLVDAARAFGDVDVWVNNAGADVLTGDAASLSFEEKLELLWRVDVEGTILLSRAIGETMRSRGGCIITIGWDRAETGMEGDSGEMFAATKGAVMAFTRSLALTLAPDVRVNCVAPGWIRTRWGEGASREWQERVLRETPLGRWGTPADVAAAVRFLASPAAEFITGQTIAVDGGAVR